MPLRQDDGIFMDRSRLLQILPISDVILRHFSLAFFALSNPVGCGVSGSLFFPVIFGFLNQLLALFELPNPVCCGVSGSFFFQLIFGFLNQLLVFFAPRPPSTVREFPWPFSTDTQPSITTELNQIRSFRKYSL
jgi:hypothetical protein